MEATKASRAKRERVPSSARIVFGPASGYQELRFEKTFCSKRATLRSFKISHVIAEPAVHKWDFQKAAAVEPPSSLE